jgi:hypothetical protein
VLILGSGGVAAAAAAGVLLTATGAAGALCYVAWAGLDTVFARRTGSRRRGALLPPVVAPAAALGTSIPAGRPAPVRPG